ncbi:LiaF transmembrane domain-containing protein [Anaeromicropila populeti]|uniref:Cell wall-active antibiotics response 4TMS YvqF n=1 Tax=Anaeromicropila populeti TaxID=37658 RepID=A0A1I6I5M7_9FIRM|nr:LiaF domain-containing protein [Anaeromicropila populeti]SFR62046.1 Cell wall-active antibiotics response 4TMS YvqF [Anaeromicropila populeti]
MRNKSSSIIWGVLFIAVGLGFVGEVYDLWSFNMLFSGWWTLFIIIPSIASIIQKGPKAFTISALIVGILILLSSLKIIDEDTVEKLIVPVIFIAIGANLLLKSVVGPSQKRIKELESGDALEYTATFSGQNIIYQDNEVFRGAEINSVFGGIKLDLRNAIINEDVVIECNAIFGGADIYLPNDVIVKVASTCIFGGVGNKKINSVNVPGAPTIYINGICLFGGVDIK